MKRREPPQADTLFDAEPEPLPAAPEADQGLSGEDLREAIHRYLMRQRQRLTAPELASVLGATIRQVKDQLHAMEDDDEVQAHGDRRSNDAVTRWEAT